MLVIKTPFFTFKLDFTIDNVKNARLWLKGSLVVIISLVLVDTNFAISVDNSGDHSMNATQPQISAMMSLAVG